MDNSVISSLNNSRRESRRGSAVSITSAAVPAIQKFDSNRKCQVLNSRKLLREESNEHRDPRYNRFAQNKRRVNQEIMDHGTGKEPVIFHSPQPLREFDYSNAISIQFVRCRNAKIRIIKSSNELKLPDGIAEAKIFQDVVKMFSEDSLAVKKLSLKYLMQQEEECQKLSKKVRDLEEKLKNAPSPAETKKNPFTLGEGLEEKKLTFCKKCRDVLTDDDLQSDEINKSLLDFQSQIKKKITGFALAGLIKPSNLL